MWRVIVPNALKVAVTKFPRADADALFTALRAMAADLIETNHTVNVVAIERPH
jgi:hypothetical protein